MPGPQPYANTLFRFTPLFPPPRGVGDAAPYSTDAPDRRALTRIFTKNIGFP